MGKKRRKSNSPSTGFQETGSGDSNAPKRAKSQKNDEDEEMGSGNDEPDTAKFLQQVKEICKNIEDLLKTFPTKKDIPSVFGTWQRTTQSKWSRSFHLWSWKLKNADILADHCVQRKANCWAIAFYRQWYALVKLKGIARSELTLRNIMKGVPLFYQDEKRALKRNGLQQVVDFMKNEGHVDEVYVHQKPEKDSENEDFERHLERLLLDGPLAVSIDTFPSYNTNNGRGILSPLPSDLERKPYETNLSHFLLLTGHDYILEEGKEPEEFWELYDSYGTEWGYSGFIRIARRQGLIKEAIEMRVNSGE